MSSGRSGHSRDSSLERKPTSPGHGSKVMDSDSEKHSITSRHSSRKKKRKQHHRQSKSPELLEQKHSKKEKKKHKSKKKHKRHHAHSEIKPSKEREEELSLKMEDKQAQDSVGSVLEGGAIEGKAHVESSMGPEIVVEPNTREDVANNVLVNNEPTVEQQEDQMTPVLVGVASPPQPNQSATEE